MRGLQSIGKLRRLLQCLARNIARLKRLAPWLAAIFGKGSGK